MTHRHTYIYMVVMAVAVLVACADTRSFDHYEHTDVQGWSRSDAVTFDVQPQWKGIYSMQLGLRATQDYPYRNLSVVVETTVLPRKECRRDTVSCTLNDDLGRMTGNNGVSLAETQHVVNELHLQQGDSLHITVHHLMRYETLPGVSEVGIRLDKLD